MIEWLVLVLVGLLLFQLFRHRSDFQFFTLLSALLAILTILVVPHLGYEFLNDLEITRLFHKQMRVPEGVYFSLVQPIIVSYSLGVLWFSFRSGSRKSQIDKLTSIIRALSDLDWMRLILLFLIFAGTHSFRSMAPSSLEFIFYLFGSLKFGVVMVMVAKARYLWLRILLLIGIPLSFALQGGMFQAYLATILAIAVILNLLKSPRTVLIASFVTIPFLFLLLLAKKELRIDAQNDELGLVEFQENFVAGGTQGLSSSKSTIAPWLADDRQLFTIYTRLNQGFLVSAVIEKMEEGDEFEESIVFRSLLASIVPRFLWSDKPKAGGRENISKYTNLNLIGGTSMNISPFAELIIEFSEFWTILSGFFYGLLFCWVLNWIESKVISGQISILLMPSMLGQIYKVETDIMTLGNILVKTILMGVMMIVIDRFILRKIAATAGMTHNPFSWRETAKPNAVDSE